MAYSIADLPLKADCDQVLAYCADELRMLAQRLSEFSYRRDNASTAADELSAELLSLNADIAFMTPLIPTLPPSKKRTERENELRRNTDRRDELVARQGERGPVALVIRELETAQLQVQITETTALQTAVQAHRATLAA